MKLLVLGKNSYPAKFFLNEIKKDKLEIIFFKKKFESKDILDLNNLSFFTKYFTELKSKFDVSLNFIHIHKEDFDLEIKINTELCNKLNYAFNEMHIKKNIYLSSVNAYEGAKTSYGKSKFSCEKIYASLSEPIIIRPSTIIEVDFNKRQIIGGKKGLSLNSLNLIIDKFYFIPVPGFGRYLQTICFGTDLAKFLRFIIFSNNFNKKTVNFFSGELISYSDFLEIYLKLKKLKRIRLFIPTFLISFALLFINKFFRKKISKKNIQNLLSQKIEYDYSIEIKKVIKLKQLISICNQK